MIHHNSIWCKRAILVEMAYYNNSCFYSLTDDFWECNGVLKYFFLTLKYVEVILNSTAWVFELPYSTVLRVLDWSRTIGRWCCWVSCLCFLYSSSSLKAEFCSGEESPCPPAASSSQHRGRHGLHRPPRFVSSTFRCSTVFLICQILI